mmetsp:Transcript_5028/g.9557  ORF Transcript_5028/g.9557 Transcript_5028/m.9557 type:complete len:584 (+) Transcript_5028:171-1922(+)
MSNFNPSFQISPAPASFNNFSGMMNHQGYHLLRQNSVHQVSEGPNSSMPVSATREESDKASAALALSALAGSKRTHSPTCVAESFPCPPVVTSTTPSNHQRHHPSFISNAKMTIEHSPEMRSNGGAYHFDCPAGGHRDPRQMLSSSMSATITPLDPCKRMKLSPSTETTAYQRFSVPTPPLPGVRNHHPSMGSAFLSRGPPRSFPEANQHHSLPVVNHSMPPTSAKGNSSMSSNPCADKEHVISFVALTHGSVPPGMSSLQNGNEYSSQDLSDNMTYEDDLDIPPNQQLLPDGTYKRRDKSLGVLCVNFMLRYNKMKVLNPESTPSVSIDEASAYLAVERRRIYDIINILESINIVSRKCKNTYNWHGIDGILGTFFNLQKEGVRIFEQDAIKTGFKVKMEEMGIDCEEEGKVEEDQQQLNRSVHAMPTGLAMLLAGAEQVDQKAKKKKTSRKKVDTAIKEKSLGRLSQKFIQLFLIGNETVALTDASDKILGETPIPELPPSAPAEEIIKARSLANKMMKTKIRRLYDIANVLASIGLIVKVNSGNNMVNTNKNRPSFKWTYPVSPNEIMETGRGKKVGNCS